MTPLPAVWMSTAPSDVLSCPCGSSTCGVRPLNKRLPEARCSLTGPRQRPAGDANSAPASQRATWASPPSTCMQPRLSNGRNKKHIPPLPALGRTLAFRRSTLGTVTVRCSKSLTVGFKNTRPVIPRSPWGREHRVSSPLRQGLRTQLLADGFAESAAFNLLVFIV